MTKRFLTVAIATWVVASTIPLATVGAAAKNDNTGLAPEEQLGKSIFFDKISDPDRMSCSTCHAPESGWSGPIPGINKKGAVYRGAIPQRFGNRKPPSAAYATLSPVFKFDTDDGTFVGGNFWDGRATGEMLGNPAADQAMAPFLNPLEQHNADATAVCEQVATAKYADLYTDVFGTIDCSTAGVMDSYENIARAIAAYEGSSEVNQFTSKYDAYLVGEAELTQEERNGLEYFNGKAGCAGCHPSTPGPYSNHPLFTDFTYDNLGVPRNPENPYYDMDMVYDGDGQLINPKGTEWLDLGLGGFLESGKSALVEDHPEWVNMASENYGRQKVPTLRNVAKIQGNAPKAYMHNGYFKSLRAVVHFYNTRDTKDTCSDEFTTEKDALAIDCWPVAEEPSNVNADELGDLGLTNKEEDAIVAFLKTLSDGYFNPESSQHRARKR